MQEVELEKVWQCCCLTSCALPADTLWCGNAAASRRRVLPVGTSGLYSPRGIDDGSDVALACVHAVVGTSWCG